MPHPPPVSLIRRSKSRQSLESEWRPPRLEDELRDKVAETAQGRQKQLEQLEQLLDSRKGELDMTTSLLNTMVADSATVKLAIAERALALREQVDVISLIMLMCDCSN